MANILIVDDNKTLQVSYTQFLEHEGHQIATASSIAEAIQYLATNTPNLILLDMLLPGGSGLELLQQYDIINAHKEVKVIAFSGLSELRIQQEAENLGVDLYMNKSSTTPADLLAVVNTVLAS